jgi:hypothetical protein
MSYELFMLRIDKLLGIYIFYSIIHYNVIVKVTTTNL